MKYSNHAIAIAVCAGVFVLCSVASQAQLVATVSPAKVEGTKAVVKLAFKNDLTNTVESARASVLLLDKEKKTVGRETRWVVGGGKDKPALPPGGTNIFYFVVTAPKPFNTTDLTASLSFDRVVLEKSRLADLKKDVQIQYNDK